MGAHACIRCIAQGQLDLVLTPPGGTIRPELMDLRRAYFEAEQPRSIIGWLYKSPGAQLLRRIAIGEITLGHDALDQLEQSPSLRHLRQLLVATGALPERDPQIAALEHHIREVFLTFSDREDASVVLRFGKWRTLAKLRQRRSKPGFASIRYQKDIFDLGASFVRSLHLKGLTLETVRQRDLDSWLSDRPRHHLKIRYFLEWANERNACVDLKLPPEPKRRDIQMFDEHDRWTQARRFLHDDSLDPADRVAGSLVLLYAQPMTRIAKLQVKDVLTMAGTTYIAFGKERVEMPEPLGSLLERLPFRRQIGPSGHAPGSSLWLFPGRQAGLPQNPEHIAKRLRELGLNPRLNRSQALAQMAAVMPASVLADLLNIHVITAVRWVKLAGGDWAGYAAQRVRLGRNHCASITDQKA